MTPQHKSDLDTPCLVLDLDVLERNLVKMQALADGAGKSLRPHAKTHKCSELARRQIEAGAIGVCAAKVSEAEALVNAGIDGILITGPVATPQKINRLVGLLPDSPSLMVVVDHRDAVDMLAAALRDRRLSMDVLLDVDVGLHRTGVAPADAPELAQHILSHDVLRLRGVQAYAGQVQHVPSYEARRAASGECMAAAVRVFRQLQGEVAICTILSASGTGTSEIDLSIPELTELQAGSYACMDVGYLDIGSAQDEAASADFEPALRLLTTVISTNQPGFVTVDAGLKSLYRHGGTPRPLAPQHTGLHYDWFGDEHGKVTCTGNAEPPALGAVLELVTSHCDPTVNLFDRFHLTRGPEAVGVWPIDLRGCSR